jgi:hypothetical protein
VTSRGSQKGPGPEDHDRCSRRLLTPQVRAAAQGRFLATTAASRAHRATGPIPEGLKRRGRVSPRGSAAS